MVTLSQRIRELGITVKVGAGHRERDDDGWEHDAYRVQLTRRGRTMTLRFRKGTGHAGSPPSLEEILECIISDSATLANVDSFEEWASDLGYDTDSRKAEATYRAVVKQDRDLRRLIGDDDALHALLLDTERD